MLLPAMVTRASAVVYQGDISQRLLPNYYLIQNIYNSWDRSLHQFQLEGVQPIQRKSVGSARTGLFFSGGVDSFYSLLEHRQEITDLIFVHGLDLDLNNYELRRQTSESVRQIALRFGKNLIEIETNVRELLDTFVSYSLYGWEIVLAVLGHLLSPQIGKLLFSLDFFQGEVFANGAMLLPMWNTEALELHPIDYSVPRTKKMERIVQDEFCLQHLRVCHHNPHGRTNCGKCEKCLRTMLSLEALGVLKDTPIFDAELHPRSVSRIYAAARTTQFYLEENRDLLLNNQGSPALVAAINKTLSRPVWIHKLRRQVGRALKQNKRRWQS